MHKILFVCHGNICRSAMGEYMLKDMVRKAGKENEFEIASAAVSTEEIGNSIYPPARRELQKHGISVTDHRAKQITRRDLDYYDGIYYMDGSNERWLKRMFPDGWQKCRKLLNRDVADPWYTGNFGATWDDLSEGCKKIMEEWMV